MKKIVSLVCLVAMVFTLGACSLQGAQQKQNAQQPTGWEYIKTKGELIVGLDATFEPMGFTDQKGEIVGFDVDLAKEAAKELGVTVKFQPISWDAKELELSSKRIDCIWNGMSITPARQETMAMTAPYFNNKIVIMGKNAGGIASLDNLVGKKIGTQQKSSALEAMQANAIYEKIKGDVLELPTYDEVLLAIKSGRVDVMVVDEVLGEYKNAKLTGADKLQVAPVNFGDDFYGIGCRQDDTDVSAKIQEAVNQVIKSGKAKELSEKWFGTNLVLEMK